MTFNTIYNLLHSKVAIIDGGGEWTCGREEEVERECFHLLSLVAEYVCVAEVDGPGP